MNVVAREGTDEQNVSCLNKNDAAPVAEYVTAVYRAWWIVLNKGIIANIAARRGMQNKHSER